MDKYKLKEYMDASPDAKLRDLVMKLLYDEIVSLRIAPGSKLNVNQIAASLGISRTPVAEAIGSLAEIGFVVTRPGQTGNFVLELNLPDMINLYQVRDAVECEAAALCAYNCDDNVVRQLSRLADAFRDSVERRDIRGMKDTDMPFHRLLINSCGNPYIVQAYEQILPKLIMYQASMLEFVVQQSNEHNPWLSSVKFNHISVVSAIRMRMPALARQCMGEHIGTSLNFTSLSGDAEDPFAALQRKER
ncbi:MAG: GntR family transcriptional regulator [Oscillospiraceae bacterium]|nr:GntR family transcriptional regulator [Oscillospiraceae bacterium]